MFYKLNHIELWIKTLDFGISTTLDFGLHSFDPSDFGLWECLSTTGGTRLRDERV